MTTAHRPTFHSAVGGDNQGGNFLVARSTKVSARDLPGQQTLKTRKPLPAPLYSDEFAEPIPTGEIRREALREKLELKEKQHQLQKARDRALVGPLEALALIPPESLVNRVPAAPLLELEDNPFPEDSDDEGVSAGRRRQQLPEGDSDESDSDDDEEEALMRELEDIRRDREEQQKRKESELAKEKEVEERARIYKANPLLVQSSLRRRWDDDVVFRNQAKDRVKPKPRFINDTVRSDFHKRFLAKYIL